MNVTGTENEIATGTETERGIGIETGIETTVTGIETTDDETTGTTAEMSEGVLARETVGTANASQPRHLVLPQQTKRLLQLRHLRLWRTRS